MDTRHTISAVSFSCLGLHFSYFVRVFPFPAFRCGVGGQNAN